MILPNWPVAAFVDGLSYFAQAGGGGSSSSNGGGVLFLLGLIGYAPMHLAGHLIRKFKKNETNWAGVQVIGWIIAAVYASLWLFLAARAFSWIPLVIAVGAPLGMGAGLYRWFSIFWRSRKTTQTLQAAAVQDPSWSETSLLERAKEVFVRYQQDWSSYNTEAMKAYMTPRYQYHASLMVYAMYLAARRNLMSDVTVEEVMIVDAVDDVDNSKDRINVAVRAKAKNVLMDTRDNSILYTIDKPFEEIWYFQRLGDKWMLDGITPSTASQLMKDNSIVDFAASQGFYYSLDWGRLLLPRRSQLFGNGRFQYSDINNHTIGMYKNCLVQIYTYIPDIRYYKNRSSFAKADSDGYIIAQAALPKTYGNIFVRRKKGWWKRPPMPGLKDMLKITLEWREFNDKYDVYASDAEKVTSLELLNPLFMEKLEALPFEVNIEVADNMVYLFAEASATSKVKPSPYPVMMDILKEAFAEMKL